VDAIGTVEVETSRVVGLADSAIPTASTMTSCTVVLPTWNSFEIARSLMPSLCFSRIAASRFSFSCTERAGGDLGVVHFRDSRFCTGWLQVVLGTSSGFDGFRYFRNLKDGPRDYAGFAPRAFSSLTKADLGVAKCRTSIWLPLQTHLGRHILGIPHFEPPPDRPRGSLNVVSAFGDPSRWNSGLC